MQQQENVSLLQRDEFDSGCEEGIIFYHQVTGDFTTVQLFLQFFILSQIKLRLF